MKNRFFVKLTYLLMTLCIAMGSFYAIPAYAAESDIQANIPTQGNDIVPFSNGNINLEYAKDVEFRHNFDFRNSTENVPSVTMPHDSRIHRVILKFWFRKDKNDNGIGNVKLTVFIKRNGVVYEGAGPFETKEVESGNNDSSHYTEAVMEFQVSMDETVSFALDASSVGLSNGNFRSIDVYRSWVYTDWKIS